MRSKKAILNIISNLLLQSIVFVYGFIVPKIIITHFGSNVNGLISSITQFLAYITLLESGFGPVVKATLYKPIAEKNNNEIASILKTAEKFFRTIAIVLAIYILLLMIFYPLLINGEFNYFFTATLIIIISISTFAEYFFGMTYKLFLQSNQETYVISVIQICTYVISIILIVILAYFNTSIHIIKLVSGLVFVLRPIAQNIYVKRKYNINFKNVDNNYKLKNKWDGLVQHIAAVIHSNTDITILSIFCNLAEVSVYSVYYLVVKGITQLVQIFSNGIDASFGDMIAKGEKHNLNKKFDIYESIFLTIITILFTCTMILITPFVKVYTKGITDVNYIRYLFGFLIVISEYIWAIRLPYSSITLVAGHFKETRKGAWIECISNLLISMLLVYKFGIVGVTIGTIVAMTIRTIEFVYHTNHYILDRKVLKTIKKIALAIIETFIIVIISQYLPMLDNISYLNWVINAIIVGATTSIIVLLINYVIYKKEYFEILTIIKNLKKTKNEGGRYEKKCD